MINANGHDFVLIVEFTVFIRIFPHKKGCQGGFIFTVDIVSVSLLKSAIKIF